MTTRSRIYIAEAFLDLGGVSYRLATGAGWDSVGGAPVHMSHRRRCALDTELTDDVLAAVEQSCLDPGVELQRMQERLELVQALPMG